MTNKLNPDTYSILFEIFGYDGSKIVTDGQDQIDFYFIMYKVILGLLILIMIGIQITC